MEENEVTGEEAKHLPNETKEDRFKRLAEQRVAATLDRYSFRAHKFSCALVRGCWDKSKKIKGLARRFQHFGRKDGIFTRSVQKKRPVG